MNHGLGRAPRTYFAADLKRVKIVNLRSVLSDSETIIPIKWQLENCERSSSTASGVPLLTLLRHVRCN